jgi:hypothetical protein
MKYYTSQEVAMHNCSEDCWVSIYDKVYNLTPLIKENRGDLALPLIKAAGTSISHWFDKDTGDVKHHVDPVRNIRMPYTPYGRFIHVPPPDPLDHCPSVELPWWFDTKYVAGRVRV